MNPYLLGGLGAGAGLLYLLDPQSGRRLVQGLAGRTARMLQSDGVPDDVARLLATAAGGGLCAWGAVRRDWVGAAAGTIGVGLLARGLVSPDPAGMPDAGPLDELVEVSRAITVAAPRERVFDLWARYENFPRFLSGVEAVTDLGEGRSHWVAAGPQGLPFGWDAEITLFVPGHVFSWRSLPRSAIRNAGIVHFDDAEGGTRVSVQMTYEPPAGELGPLAARLFGADPGGHLDEDLLSIKTFIETGASRRDASPLH